MSNSPQQQLFDNAGQVAEAALALLLEQSRQAIAERGRFVLALAGGSTPALLYQLLAQCNEPWQHWYLVYGDERCLPVGDKGRNSTLVSSQWLEKINFPPGQHLLPVCTGDVELAARQYSERIAPLLPLDMALLGMGEDGHTASLFPGHSHPQQAVVPVVDAPKPPGKRISLSYSTLCAARMVCYLIVGASKRDALDAYWQGADIPARRVCGSERTLLLVGS